MATKFLSSAKDLLPTKSVLAPARLRDPFTPEPTVVLQKGIVGWFQKEWARSKLRRTVRRDVPLWRRLVRTAMLGFVVFMCLLLTLTGNGLYVAIPVVVVALGWLALAVPFDVVAPAFIFIILSLDAPGLQPAENNWRSPLYGLGGVLYNNLPTKFAIVDLLIMVLVVRAIFVIVLSDSGTTSIDRRPPRPFAQAMLISAGSILAYTFYGIYNDGSFANALWQIRQPFWFPLLALAISVAATPSCIRRLRTVILAAGLIKAAQGIYYYFAIAPGLNVVPHFVTTHSDSVTWATCTSILLAEWFEERTRKTRRNMLLCAPIYLLAMTVNNRRTVWVMLAASVLFIVAQAHGPVKKQLARILAVAWPLFAVYIVVGLSVSSNSPVFKPVRMTESVLLQDDASSDTRDIENFNLLVTLKAKPIVGFGFGHEYIEMIVAYDIAKEFPQYRYKPHNSFLGMWAFIGLPGSAFYFLFLVVGVFYAVAARRKSTNPKTRAAAAWAVCTVIAYLIQGWSDLGVQDWLAIVIGGVGVGIGGAIPRHVRSEPTYSPPAEMVAGRAGSALSPMEEEGVSVAIRESVPVG